MVHLESTQIVSLPGLILYDTNELRKKDKEFKRVKNKLVKDFKVRRVARLQKRYMRDPQKYQAAFKEVADLFVADYAAFRKVYAQLLKGVVDALFVADQSQYNDLLRIKQIVDQVSKSAKQSPGRFYFPPSSRKHFHQEFGRALRRLAAQLSEEYATYQVIAQGKKFSRWYKRFVRSRGRAERQALRAAGKMQEQVKETQQASALIQKALGDGGTPELPMLLIRYIIEQEKTDRMMKHFKKDAALIIEDVMAEVHKVVLKMAPFLIVIEADQKVKERIERERVKFTAQQQEIEKQLGKLADWPKMYTAAQVKSLSDEERRMIEILSKIGKKDVDDAVNSVINREMGGRKAA